MGVDTTYTTARGDEPGGSPSALPGEQQTAGFPSSAPAADQLTSILQRLTDMQVRFVYARAATASNRKACEMAGVGETSVYDWHEYRLVMQAVKLLAVDALESARAMRRRALTEAMRVKLEGLRDPDSKVRQAVASEIIEWEMGKAAAAIERHLHGGTVVVEIREVKDWERGGVVDVIDAEAVDMLPEPDDSDTLQTTIDDSTSEHR